MATTSKNEPDSTIINNVAVGLYYYYVPKMVQLKQLIWVL